MQERANLLGGTCSFRSRPGAGCTVVIEVPIRAKENRMSEKIRLLLADDHAVLRSDLRLLLSEQPDMEVVGEAADGERGHR